MHNFGAAIYAVTVDYWIDDAELKLRCSMLLLKAIQYEQSSHSRGSPNFKATVDSSTDIFSDLSEEQLDQPHLQFLRDSTRALHAKQA